MPDLNNDLFTLAMSEKAQPLMDAVSLHIRDNVVPIIDEFQSLEKDKADRWSWHPRQLELLDGAKQKAKESGLWNFFLPDSEMGEGLTNLDYAYIASELGKYALASETLNCSAPDTGNMEVLWRYGSEEQKAKWLTPLLAGEIRSVFCMTEPAVASSDATNMQATAVIEGDEIVLNGRKWWSSGLGDPNAKIIIFMAHTPDETKDRHHQHSMVLVPVETAGVKIERMLPVFGDYDAPHGHGEISFSNVRVPISNFIGGAGQGFEIAQGRLGPGRIHHCMRCIGAAEKSLELMIDRGMSRTAFGKEILKLGGNLERVADARVAIDQARLLTLYAAYKMDTLGNMAALTEISAIKVVAPSVLEKVVDMAIQIHGGAGVSRDTPLTGFFAQARSLRLADGPDEVHKGMIAKLELAKRGYSTRRKK